MHDASEVSDVHATARTNWGPQLHLLCTTGALYMHTPYLQRCVIPILL